MRKIVQKYWEEKPYYVVMIAALFIRLIAAIFSKGFGMHDDHFLVIGTSSSWVDGLDYYHWLPWNRENPTPSGHSFLYAGLHYVLFSIIKVFHITDPQIKMLIIRLLHALFSLIVVSLGYKYTEKHSSVKTAKTVGLLLALLWFIPWMSVRNLVESFSIPFLFMGIWIIDKHRSELLWKYGLWAGFLLGLAFSIRFQTLVFTGGVGLALLYNKQWKEMFVVAFGVLLSIFIVQGGVDMIVWGRPFAELTEYVLYNINHATDYIVLGWYTYLILIMGILIPPIGVMLFFGYLKTWKKHLLVFLPTLLFLLFHSTFPNKQERFILPIVPFIVMLGVIGWNEFVKTSVYWTKHKKLLKGCWTFFWILNIVVLSFVSTMYGKRARVESMTYLSKYENIQNLLIENTNREHAKMPPLFYLNQWADYRELGNGVENFPFEKVYPVLNDNTSPRFILFFGNKNLDNRVAYMKQKLPNIEYETTIEPSFVDKVMYWLNPVNANRSVYIYRNKDFFPRIKE